MRSEKFDKKIIEAAENHHPSYDGDGWKQMEELLNKHLPQKKEKKKRFIFFILFLLLFIGTGGWYLFKKEGIGYKNNQEAANNLPQKKKELNKRENSAAEKSAEQQIPITQLSENTAVLPHKKSLLIEESLKKSRSSLNVIYKSKISTKTQQSDLIENKKSKKSLNNNIAEKISFTPESKNQDYSNKKTIDQTTHPIPDFSSSPEKETAEINLKELPNLKEDKNTEYEKDSLLIPNQKAKHNKSSFFFLSLGAGPDLSFVGKNGYGKTKLFGGIGLGYHMKNGLRISSGFYAGRKIYSATAESYNPPSVFFQYYPILEKVDADCKVYEIPISLSYHFGKSEYQNWFAGVGLSTLLMKEEYYTYTYKYNSTGPSYMKDWTVNNKNKHFLSVLTLSGGYQRQLNKRITISAEPYIKIPLQGLGYGNVKMNSTGIMFNLSLKPFRNGAKK